MKLLIIRGWRSKKEHWLETKKILEKEGIDVLLPDLPGVSEEGEEIEKAWSIDDYKNWILEYAKENDWNKFNLLGHSFGGAIAVKIAAESPNRVEKLILCAPAVSGTRSLKAIFFYLTAQATKSVFSLPLLNRKMPKVKEKLSSKGIKDHYFESELRKKILKKAAKENHEENLKKIREETLILWGGKDKTILPKYANKIKEIIPNSKIVFFDSSSHHPHKEVPGAFAKEIIKFII